MANTDILYIAIGVFILLIIGIGLTIWEFQSHVIDEPEEDQRQQFKK